MSDAHLYTHGSRIDCLLVVKNYLNNYFVMYTRLAGSFIRVYLASPADLGLGIV